LADDVPAVELTVLMPCLNEAETVETCIAKALDYLKRAGIAGEVLIADNGSTDGSQALATAAGARVVEAPARGYGAALQCGVRAARGRLVIMGDADDSYDFAALEPFVAALRGGADLVMGNRFAGGIKPGAMPPLHRWIGNPVLSFVGRLFFRIPVSDFHCGLRGFSRAAIVSLQLHSPGMEFASEMIVKSALRGLKIVEVPTTLSPDGRTRAPHLQTWRDGWRHLRFLLLHSPRWLFLYPGLLCILGGVAAATLLISGPVAIAPGIRIDVHSLIAACFLIIIGGQLVLFSALARKYAELEGFLPPTQGFRATIVGLTLERVLLISLALFVCGGTGVVWSAAVWARSGFGPIPYNTLMRILMVSFTAVTLSIQFAATGFLASVFAIRQPPVEP
jgi:glycosyltransferase involved in cell wall biosynthesis